MNVRCLLLDIRDAEPRDARADGCLGVVCAKMDQLDDVALRDDRTRNPATPSTNACGTSANAVALELPPVLGLPERVVAPYPDAQNESVARDIPNHLCLRVATAPDRFAL